MAGFPIAIKNGKLGKGLIAKRNIKKGEILFD